MMTKDDFMLEISAEECCDPEDKEICPKFGLNIYWGNDGVPVIEVITKELVADEQGEPPCRVYINDGLVHQHPVAFDPNY